MDVEVIGLDGDDTLWHNERMFTLTQERFRQLLAPYVSADRLDAHLFETQTANLELFGYGVKAFTLSMIETAVELTGGAVSANDIQRIIDAGKEMAIHPVVLLDGVAETIAALADRYRLMLVTKGDLFDQESKLARSGLADRFWRVAIVARKDPAAYRRVLGDAGVEPGRFLMVGNSVPSDVAPVVAIGGRAAHVPYDLTWAHETAEPIADHERVWNLTSIIELPARLSGHPGPGGPGPGGPGPGDGHPGSGGPGRP